VAPVAKKADPGPVLPLPEARALLQRARAETGLILVALSGGKDSLCTLDLAVEVFGPRNVVAFSMYLVKGLRCFEGPIEAAARRYGVRVEYVPHWMLGRMYKFAYLMPHRGNAHEWRETKLTDIEQLVRKRTGIDWIAYGHRAAESPHRRGMLNSFQGFNDRQKRVYPVWRWRVGDVYAYVRARRIPLPPTFGTYRAGGVSLNPEALTFIKKHFPDDYGKILEVFPFAEVQLKRRELYPPEEDT
jgi:3'-phosphoadenosine 5'-phosphosulfate sulfotransferase (PAPS reductase)/FAD synthetase